MFDDCVISLIDFFLSTKNTASKKKNFEDFEEENFFSFLSALLFF
jgi:hypothetical protein